jgi:hypothetical protein
MKDQTPAPHTDNNEKPIAKPGHMPSQPVTKREDEPKEASEKKPR